MPSSAARSLTEVSRLLMAAWGQARGPLVRLRDSEFGIWIHHKGVVLFDGAPDLRDIAEAIERMDTLLLPRLQSALQQQQPLEQAIGAVKNQLDLIRLKLNDLFEHCLGQDDGLDQETQLPDRRYLPAILVREMQAHSASARVFCVGMLGLQFPELRDSGARSRLMQVAANTLVANIRTTDHLFRYDEQRFLLIAVECDRQKASELLAGLSEELRHALQAGPVNGSWTPVHTGLSVGVAEYDRHPDYQYLIQRAETAQTDSERAGDHLAVDAVYASPEWTLEEATEAMRRGGFRHLVVLDGSEVIGLISMRDIVKAWQPTRVS